MSEANPTVRAPDFPAGLEWLNVRRPLSLKGDLRGKFVLLDFWTYGCINCIHVLPDLHRLEEEFSGSLVVIGVHSGKFDNETDTERLRDAVQRYGITHPVVNDRRFHMWQQYAVKAWPTFYLIDPNGYIAGTRRGEGVYAPVAALLHRLLPTYEIDSTPLDERLDVPVPLPEGVLAYPSKIAVDQARGRLFVADSGHHRILVTDLDGNGLLRIGSGRAGLADGDADMAEFFRPQGLAYEAERDRLFVADTGNHAIRSVDLQSGQVRTVAGTGRQAPYGFAKVKGTVDPLSSPWDVIVHAGRLYVAMAGAHQVWAFDPETGEGEPFAGDGQENLVDGPRRQAIFAQPSGLAADEHALYVADSESSAVRRIDWTSGEVTTPAGLGLFVFGDADGEGEAIRLQHPLGVALQDGDVLVADTYNHAIKRLTLSEPARAERLAGQSEAGHTDGGLAEAQFDEPSGVAVAGSQVYVADTNNHAIRVIDLGAERVSTLPVTEPPLPGHLPEPRVVDARVRPGASVLYIEPALTEGHVLNVAAPGDFRARISTGSRKLRTGEVTFDGTRWRIPIDVYEPGDLRITGRIYTCDVPDSAGLCYVEPVRLLVRLHLDADAPSDVILNV